VSLGAAGETKRTNPNRLKQLNIKRVLTGSAEASFHAQNQGLCQPASSSRHKPGWTPLFHSTGASQQEGAQHSGIPEKQSPGCCTCQTHLLSSQAWAL